MHQSLSTIVGSSRTGSQAGLEHTPQATGKPISRAGRNGRIPAILPGPGRNSDDSHQAIPRISTSAWPPRQGKARVAFLRRERSRSTLKNRPFSFTAAAVDRTRAVGGARGHDRPGAKTVRPASPGPSEVAEPTAWVTLDHPGNRCQVSRSRRRAHPYISKNNFRAVSVRGGFCLFTTVPRPNASEVGTTDLRYSPDNGLV